MPNGIDSNYQNVNLQNTRRDEVSRPESQQRPEGPQAPDSRDVAELQSQASANEQRSRDRAAQNNGLLASPSEQVTAPSAETISQLQQNQQQQAPANASGLGVTANKAYQSLANQEFSQNISQSVKVDITA